MSDFISTLELRRLLFELKDFRQDVRVRFRMLGEMWQVRHYRVRKLTEKGAVLGDENTGAILIVRDMNDVMQFELDKPFRHFQAYNPYKVDHLLVQSKKAKVQ